MVDIGCDDGAGSPDEPISTDHEQIKAIEKKGGATWSYLGRLRV